MLQRWSVWNAVFPGLIGALLSVGCEGCPGVKPSPSPAEASGKPVVSAVPSVQAPERARCVDVTPGASFVIGKAPTRPTADAGDEALNLPFAVELGNAVPLAKAGFAVTALRVEGGATHALVALVGGDAGRGKVVDLGRVHGDVDPPRAVTRDGRLFVGVVDSDSSATTVRLAEITDPAGAASVTWGATLQQGNDESQVFGIAVGKERGVLVWDEWDKPAGHSVVRSATFSLSNLSNVTTSRVISPKETDAEAPQLQQRPGGGYWLAWYAHSGVDPAELKKRPLPEAGPDAGEEELAVLVETGERWLEVTALDENGSRSAEPQRVSETGQRVLVSDMAVTDAGAAVLAWRDHDGAPGVEKQLVRLARVDAGGAIVRQVIDDDAVGSGVPELVVPTASAGEQAPTRVWLALADVMDETRLAPLGLDLNLRGELATDPKVAQQQILAARGTVLLLARPQGLAMELSALSCVVDGATGH